MFGFCSGQSNELSVMSDQPALCMQWILTRTVAQCTAGPSPSIAPVARLLVTSETEVKLSAVLKVKSEGSPSVLMRLSEAVTADDDHDWM